MRLVDVLGFAGSLSLLAAFACSGSDSGSKTGTVGSSGGQGALPSNGGSESGSGGDSATGGTQPGAGGTGTGSGGAANGGQGGQGDGCTFACQGTSSLSKTCPGSQVTQDCGTICASRGLVGSVCSGTDCVCSDPNAGTGGTSGGSGGSGGGTCTGECVGNDLKTTCPGSTSQVGCSTICQNRGLYGSQCLDGDCVCSIDPVCTTTCAGASSLKKTCGGSSTTQDCGTICSQRGQVGTTCSGNDCVCNGGTGGATGAGGSGAGGGHPVGCTSKCYDDDPTYHQSTHVDTTCYDSQGGFKTTSLFCIQTGAPCEGGLATCEANACKCL